MHPNQHYSVVISTLNSNTKSVVILESFEELDESELGQEEYWRSRYDEELHNFARNPDDVGEIWFGEDIENRVVQYLLTQETCDKNERVIDLGCGNGMLLIQLAKNGFTNLLGVDYCENAIALAKNVAKIYNQVNIDFKTIDILKKENTDKKQLFGKALDKGTYDAISLMADPRKNRALYMENVKALLEENGFLVLTSCNWTKEELMKQFRGHFDWYADIETPEFKFGGKVGNVVTCIVFKNTC